MPPPSLDNLRALPLGRWGSDTLARLECGQSRPEFRYLAEPWRVLADAGFPPDPWQKDLLSTNADRILMGITRQGGKSLTAAALALSHALIYPDSLILLVSRALRQSGELFRDKLLRLYRGIGQPVPPAALTALTLTLANGSRILSLPGDGDTIVGFSSVAMLVIDEAARVPDDLYRMVRPMLAVSRGKLVALSTPYGKRGFFYEEWHGANRWLRVKLTAPECPRIDARFLEEERAALGERWYQQEYMVSFEETADTVFHHDDIEVAFRDDIEPFDLGG